MTTYLYAVQLIFGAKPMKTEKPSQSLRNVTQR
jgi:hypothetical protein